MSETTLTKKIKIALYQYTKAHLQGIYGVFECVMGVNTIGYGNEYVDFLTMSSDSEFRCYEIKVSEKDLHRNAQLSFYGDYNYLVIPDEDIVPGLLQESIHFVSGVYGNKTGILVYHEGQNGIPHFTVAWRAKKQKLRIEQRIANMYNMVRSMSRYVTKDVKQNFPKKEIFDDIF